MDYYRIGIHPAPFIRSVSDADGLSFSNPRESKGLHLRYERVSDRINPQPCRRRSRDAGKTQLISSLLYVSGATPRWGKVDEGTTTTDYEEDSHSTQDHIKSALAHLDHRDTKVNFMIHRICCIYNPRTSGSSRSRLRPGGG